MGRIADMARAKQKLKEKKLRKYNAALNKIIQRNESNDNLEKPKKKKKNKGARIVYQNVESNRSRH